MYAQKHALRSIYSCVFQVLFYGNLEPQKDILKQSNTDNLQVF